MQYTMGVTGNKALVTKRGPAFSIGIVAISRERQANSGGAATRTAELNRSKTRSTFGCTSQYNGHYHFLKQKMEDTMGAFALAVCCLTLLTLAIAGITPRRLFAAGVALLILSVFTLSSFAFFIAISFLASAIAVRYLAEEATTTKLAIMFGFAAIGFSLIAVPRWKETIERVKARDQLAYESLRSRATPVNSNRYEVDIGGKSAREVRAEQYHPALPWQSRGRAIAWLHRSAVGHFLETPDFGVLRMGYPSLRDLENGDGSPIELPMPDEHYPPFDSAEFESSEGYASRRADASRWGDKLSAGHRKYGSWFLDSNRFGDIQDLDNVAGFLPHAIVQREEKPLDIQSPLAPGRRKETPPIQLKKLQLLGLLYHEEPIVYELDTMPELLSAATAPIRPLDLFEQRGLQQLLEGEFIHVEQIGSRLRMLGALRSSESCVECHEGPTNQLLGAFSYVLETNDASESATQGTPLTMQLSK